MNLTAMLVVTLVVAPSPPLKHEAVTPCEILVGTWEGEHTYEGSGIYTKYRGSHSADGTFSASIEIVEPGKPKRVQLQKGNWVCQGNVFATVVVSQEGTQAAYRYQLLDVKPGHMKYQNFSNDQLGPVFEANKVKE